MNDRAILAVGGAALLALALAFTALNPQAWTSGRRADTGPTATVLAAAGGAAGRTEAGRTEAAVAAPRGDAAPLTQPWLELRVADGRLVLDGTVGDAATHALVLSRAIGRHGAAAIDDRVTVRPTAQSAAFDAGLVTFPPDLGGARAATVRLTAEGLAWQGDRPAVEAASAPAAELAATPAMATAAAPAATTAATPAATPDAAPAAAPDATTAATPAAEPAGATVVAATDDREVGTIHFTTNSVALTPKALQLLGASLPRLRDDPERRITVVGYADARGSPELNRILSEQRARATAAWLQTRGIARDRIVVVGAGVDAAATDATDVLQSMRQARRVELRLS